MRGTRKRRLLPLEAISDFRLGIDRVDRRDGRLFVVDGQGYLADVEVQNGETPEALETFGENVAKMTRAGDLSAWGQRVRFTSLLSRDGKLERLAVLSSRWRALFDDAKFVVED
jgi:hypothetical protein